MTTTQKLNIGTPPPAVAALLGRLPAWPGSMLAAAALNRVLVPHLPDDVRTALRDRKLRLRVTDAGVAVDFTWRGDRFAALAPPLPASPPDLEIAASARDFAALARREEDPDTLFFSRRLAMEGDTELGLLVKNTLDAIDVPLPELVRQALPAWLRSALERVLAAGSRRAPHLEPRE
jgi:predicted lipid carrier protein YhbT